MSNIILNGNCNRRCAYCFAGESVENAKKMTLDNLTIICDFLERSRKRKVNVLGGEPTLHPEFDVFLEYLFSRGFAVHVFTNGLVSVEMLEAIEKVVKKRRISRRRLKFVVNVNEEKYRMPEETAMQVRTFEKLNRFCSLSFNVFEKECELGFLAQMIADHQLVPEIRLGLAAPVRGKRNRYLSPADYGVIARKISAFSDECQPHGIDMVFDCGFPLCVFTDAELGKLYRHKTQLKFVCRSIPDIDPDLNVFHCYPLSGYFPQKLTHFRDLRDIHFYFETLMAGQGQLPGIFERCRDCEHRRRGMCAAGCKGHYIESEEMETAA